MVKTEDACRRLATARSFKIMKRLVQPLELMLLATFFMALSAVFVWLQNYENDPYRLVLQSSFTSSSSSSSTATTRRYAFKILQLADLHLGEAEEMDWGPQQDVKTWAVLQSVIPAENPDLIVLSGDQLTANNIDANATVYYQQLCHHLQSYNIPWAMIFGNHDDAGLELGDGASSGVVIYTNQTKTSRQDLYHVDHSFAPLSRTQMGPRELFGTSNYILNVYYDNDNHHQDAALQILFLDSGGGTLPQQIETNQVEWFQSQRQRRGYNKYKIPMVAFQHIPTKEFVYSNDNNQCQGMQDDGVDALQPDSNLVDALVQDGNVHFLAVGHQHGNDYCCSYNDNNGNDNNNSKMHVCFGRHSGYGGYGQWDRGARVYELQFQAPDDTSSIANGNNQPSHVMTWKTWVRMESGEIIDTYSPYGNHNNGDGGDQDEQ